jgi:type II secretory pathway component PulM
MKAISHVTTWHPLKDHTRKVPAMFDNNKELNSKITT